jgi:hypothetical protein
MKRILPALFLLPGVALAHHGETHPAANLHAQARPDPAIQEMQRHQANPTVLPGVQAQRREAEAVEQAGIDDAIGQLRAAQTAIRARRLGQANEFLERAEARLLTRSTVAARAGEAVRSGPTGHIAAARSSLQRMDYSAAGREVEQAIAELERPRRSR